MRYQNENVHYFDFICIVQKKHLWVAERKARFQLLPVRKLAKQQVTKHISEVKLIPICRCLSLKMYG